MPQKDMLDVWHALLTAVFDPYRPELHYMRGPGPKWRAKHAYVPDASLDCPLHRIAA